MKKVGLLATILTITHAIVGFIFCGWAVALCLRQHSSFVSDDWISITLYNWIELLPYALLLWVIIFLVFKFVPIKDKSSVIAPLLVSHTGVGTICMQSVKTNYAIYHYELDDVFVSENNMAIFMIQYCIVAIVVWLLMYLIVSRFFRNEE